MHVKEFLEKSPLEKGPEYYLRTGDCYINWSMEAKIWCLCDLPQISS